MTLKCDRGTEDDVRDLGPGSPPDGVAMARWAAGEPQGKREGKALGWRRGQQSGWIEAVLTLQEMGHTRIAAKLQRHFGLDDTGALHL